MSKKLKSVRIKYEAVVVMDIDFHPEQGTKVNSIELEYDHNMPTDPWITDDGNFTHHGVEALLFGFASGLSSIIHNAGQINGADTVQLYNKAMGIIQQQLGSAVRIEQKKTSKPSRFN